MSRKPRRRKCLCCRRAFTPDYRNQERQRYCTNPRCRHASHLASQRRWRRKPENQDCVRGPDEVRRVQTWRQEHPGYWKQKSPPVSESQPIGKEPVNSEQSSRNAPPAPGLPLQDVCLEQNPVFIGLISLITGNTLRDDIAATFGRVLRMGENILGLQRTPTTTAMPVAYDRQVPDSTGAAASDSQRL